MADTKDYLAVYRQFFEEFATTVNPDDQLPVKVAGYYLCESELVGEIVDWTLQYLNQKRCPSSLVAPLTRIVVEEIQHACRKHPAACGYRAVDNTYQPLKLMQVVTGKVNEVCLRYRDNGKLATLPPPSPGPPISSCAIKNTRRRMEDRHVIIEDFHAVFNIQDWCATSYYAVFDGHAGTDAAVYSVSHLHQFLAESPFYPTDPERALKDAFSRTDALFLEKSNKENLRSGTTAVCALLRPKEKMLYVAWLGDSQAVLVRNGQPVRVVHPHKPDRQDERERIEVMGGCVLFWGTWRVNGQLAVSRAIGDPEYKPYVTAEPDVTALPLNGSEDFLVLACDGLWDFVTEQEAVEAVYQQLCDAPGDVEAVSERLVQLSKQQGSTDNISVIVVFLRDPAQLRRAMESNATGLLNGSGAVPTPADLYFLDDFGPETDVDAVDDVLLCPTKAALSCNNNPLSDLELQRQQLSDFDPAREPRQDTPTPPADQLAVAGVASEADNVAESGEDSEDEWNYYRVEPSADESQQSTQSICEKSAAQQLEDESNMESQLNPDAAEFVPSPTQPMPSMEEVLLAQSPRKGVPMEDIPMPSQTEFQHEVSQRPSDVEKLPDLLGDVHNGGSCSDLEQVNRLDESEVCSTKAEFGDDSTLSFLTTTSEMHKTLADSFKNLAESLDESFVEQDLLGTDFASGVSKSNNGSTCDDNELSELNESEMLVSESAVEEKAVFENSEVLVNTHTMVPMSFELQKELVPEMETRPELVQLESEGTSSFEQDESGSPLEKKIEPPQRPVTPSPAESLLDTTTSTVEQEVKEIELYPDMVEPGFKADLDATLLDFSLSHEVSEEPLPHEKLVHDDIRQEEFKLVTLTEEVVLEEQEIAATLTPPSTPAQVSDDEPNKVLSSLLTSEPALSPIQTPITEQIPSPTSVALSEQISPLSEQILSATLETLSEQTPPPNLMTLSEQILPPTLETLSEQIPPSILDISSEQIPPSTQEILSEQIPSPTLETLSEQIFPPTLETLSEQISPPTLMTLSEEIPPPTLVTMSEQISLPTLVSPSEQTPDPILEPVVEPPIQPTVSEQVSNALSEALVSPILAPVSEPIQQSIPVPVCDPLLSSVSEPKISITQQSLSAPEELIEAPTPTVAPVPVLETEVLSPEKKVPIKKPTPTKDKKTLAHADKTKATKTVQKTTLAAKTVQQKSVPTSPTKPLSSTIRSSTPKKPAAATTMSKPTKPTVTTSKPAASPPKPSIPKTAPVRQRPVATTTSTTKTSGLSNGDVTKAAATKKATPTTTGRPLPRPASAPTAAATTRQPASRTAPVTASAPRLKPAAMNGTATKTTRTSGMVTTATARNKVAATDKQVKETANKQILSARTVASKTTTTTRTTTASATRKVASSATKMTVTTTTAVGKVPPKKTTTSTGVARTTATSTKITKTAVSVTSSENNESAVQVAD